MKPTFITLLFILTYLISGCASPFRAGIANEQYVQSKVAAPIIDAGIFYRQFNKKGPSGPFHGQVEEALNSPAFHFGEDWYGRDGFLTAAKGDLDIDTDIQSGETIDGVINNEKNGKQISYRFIRYNGAVKYNFVNGMAMIGKAYLTVTEKDPQKALLIFGMPMNGDTIMIRNGNVRIDKVIDNRQKVYSNLEQFKIGLDYPVYKVEIPIAVLGGFASDDNPLIFKASGKLLWGTNVYGDSRAGSEISYLINIPRWYLKAFIFAAIKTGFVEEGVVSETIISEYRTLEAKP